MKHCLIDKSLVESGKLEHFSGVSEKSLAEAALAAVIFQREEVPIEAVKEHMRFEGIETR